MKHVGVGMVCLTPVAVCTYVRMLEPLCHPCWQRATGVCTSVIRSKVCYSFSGVAERRQQTPRSPAYIMLSVYIT